MKQITRDNQVKYELSEDECTTLLRSAKKAINHIYPKGEVGFSVALMTTAGNIYEGVSYKSDTFTLTMHAEMTALAHAAIHGDTDIVAITGPNCHICKQMIFESSLRSGIDMVVVIDDADGVKQVPISEQMPYAWPAKTEENR